jgi:hypothetical protein
VNFHLRPSVLEQARAGIEFVRRYGARCAHARRSAGLHHEAAADTVVLLARQYLQVRVVRREAHAVGMTRQDLVHVEQQIERFIEGYLMLAQQADAAVAADPLQYGLDGGRIDGVGAHALESQQHRAIRAMPPAGQRQGAIQLRGQLRGALQ